MKHRILINLKSQNLLFLGAYVPLTMEGRIVVDGILTSCYASVDHDLAHIGMTPLRWFSWMVEQIYGEDNGSPGYVEITKHIRRLIPFKQ